MEKMFKNIIKGIIKLILSPFVMSIILLTCLIDILILLGSNVTEELISFKIINWFFNL
jgi:hypothetical protein